MLALCLNRLELDFPEIKSKFKIQKMLVSKKALSHFQHTYFVYLIKFLNLSLKWMLFIPFERVWDDNESK